MARMAISTAYMCFRRASEAVYSCISARRAVAGPGHGVVPAHCLLLRIPGGERHPAGQLAVEADLEGVLAGAGQGNVEHQHRAGLDVDHAGRRLAELHRALAAQQLGPAVIHEADPDGVDADLGAPAAHPQHQVGAGIDRRESWTARRAGTCPAR